jgi:hypothetical protein
MMMIEQTPELEKSFKELEGKTDKKSNAERDSLTKI